MDDHFAKYAGKKIYLPEQKECYAAEYVEYYRPANFLIIEQYNWHPNCRYVLNLQTDNESKIVAITIDSVEETVFIGEAIDQMERDPDEGDYEYLTKMLDFLTSEGAYD